MDNDWSERLDGELMRNEYSSPQSQGGKAQKLELKPPSARHKSPGNESIGFSSRGSRYSSNNSRGSSARLRPKQPYHMEMSPTVWQQGELALNTKQFISGHQSESMSY